MKGETDHVSSCVLEISRNKGRHPWKEDATVCLENLPSKRSTVARASSAQSNAPKVHTNSIYLNPKRPHANQRKHPPGQNKLSSNRWPYSVPHTQQLCFVNYDNMTRSLRSIERWTIHTRSQCFKSEIKTQIEPPGATLESRRRERSSGIN